MLTLLCVGNPVRINRRSGRPRNDRTAQQWEQPGGPVQQAEVLQHVATRPTTCSNTLQHRAGRSERRAGAWQVRKVLINWRATDPSVSIVSSEVRAPPRLSSGASPRPEGSGGTGEYCCRARRRGSERPSLGSGASRSRPLHGNRFYAARCALHACGVAHAATLRLCRFARRRFRLAIQCCRRAEQRRSAFRVCVDRRTAFFRVCTQRCLRCT